MIPRRKPQGRRYIGWHFGLWALLLLLFLLPFAAMQISPQVRWNSGDFAAAAALLCSFGLMVEASVYFAPNWRSRTWLIVAAAAIAAVIWADAAVGIF